MENTTGILPALVTPYDKKGNINESSLRSIIRMNIKKGVSGFYVNGSTAETFLLSLEERKRLIDIVMDEVNDESTIIYHVGNISTDVAIELAKYGEKLNVNAISAIPPFYYNFSFQEIKDYYKKINDSVNIPMVIYNFPSNSGVKMQLSDFKELMEDDRIIGVKHTSMDLYELERIKQTTNKIIFNGHDEVFLGGLAMGASGAIGSTFNLIAEKFIKIFESFHKGEIRKAYEMQIEANNIIEALVKVGVVQGVKYGLEKSGIECNGMRTPFKLLSKEEKAYLDKVFYDNKVNF